jgi:hypothetical protein
MDGADHCPFASDLPETAEQELSKASGLFFLSEDWLDHRFAQSVPAAPACPSYLVCHSLHQGRAFQHAPGHGVRAAVANAARAEKGIDLAILHGSDFGFTGKACVIRDLAGNAAQIGGIGRSTAPVRRNPLGWC